jgi:hypothetical protein
VTSVHEAKEKKSTKEVLTNDIVHYFVFKYSFRLIGLMRTEREKYTGKIKI